MHQIGMSGAYLGLKHAKSNGAGFESLQQVIPENQNFRQKLYILLILNEKNCIEMV